MHSPPFRFSIWSWWAAAPIGGSGPCGRMWLPRCGRRALLAGGRDCGAPACRPCASRLPAPTWTGSRPRAAVGERSRVGHHGGPCSSPGCGSWPGQHHRRGRSVREIIPEAFDRRAQPTVVGHPAMFDLRLDHGLHPGRLRLTHRHGEGRLRGSWNPADGEKPVKEHEWQRRAHAG
jgi:hypothetical protein